MVEGSLKFQYSAYVSVLLSAMLLVAGCHHKSVEHLPLPTRPLNTCDKTRAVLTQQFTHSGMQVINIGEDYMLSIPAHLLFYNQAPRIRWNSYRLLNDIACYLKQYRKVSVTVTSYASHYASIKRERALTLARSRAVGDYLVTRDIDSRLIFTQGAGADKPITTQLGEGDLSPNARVEITFRQAVD